MVSADHSSGCMCDAGMELGGEPAGFVIKTDTWSVYHSGDTNVFGDMAIIDYLYKPNVLLVNIGGMATMGPEEAGFAVAKLFRHAKTIIPMHYGTFPMLKGTVAEFKEHLARFSEEWKRDPIDVVDAHTLQHNSIPLPLQ